MLARGLANREANREGLGGPWEVREAPVAFRVAAGPGFPAPSVNECRGGSHSQADRHTETPPCPTKARISASEWWGGGGVLLLLMRNRVGIPKGKVKVELGAHHLKPHPGACFFAKGLQADRVPCCDHWPLMLLLPPSTLLARPGPPLVSWLALSLLCIPCSTLALSLSPPPPTLVLPWPCPDSPSPTPLAFPSPSLPLPLSPYTSGSHPYPPTFRCLQLFPTCPW